jgi:hypothetical protein
MYRVALVLTLLAAALLTTTPTTAQNAPVDPPPAPGRLVVFEAFMRPT